MAAKKRLLPILVALLMVFAMMPMMAQTAYAEDTLTVDGVVYTLNDDGTAAVTGHTDDLPSTVTIPSSVGDNGEYTVTSIGDWAFFKCSNLQQVTFADDSCLKAIGVDAFVQCTSLDSFSIPDTVTEIGNDAFSHTALESIVLPEGLTIIGSYLFDGCSSLQEVTIPSTVTEIWDFAFYECASLNKIHFGGSPFQWAAIIGNGKPADELVKDYGKEDSVWVAGVQVTSDNLTINSEDSDDITSGSAVYDPQKRTLTLDNFVYSGPGSVPKIGGLAAICIEDFINLTIELKGTSTITQTRSDGASYGILFDCYNSRGGKKITIQSADETAVLNVNSGKSETDISRGIYSRYVDLEFAGGEVNINAGYGKLHSFALQSEWNDITVSGGKVTARGGKADTYDSNGIIMYRGPLYVEENATLIGIGGDATRYSYGFEDINGETISVSGNMTLTGNTAAVNNSKVINKVAGKGWTNVDGTEGEEVIEISETARELNSAYKKVQFTYEAPKPQLTITAKDQTYTYDGQTHGEGELVYDDPAEIAEKVTVEGLQDGDALTSIIIDGQGRDVGTYDIVPSGATVNGVSATNKYDVTYVNGTLTIVNPAPSYDAVDEVINKINALTEPYDEAKVKEAREAYDKLTPAQKEDRRFTEEVLKKLTDAEAAVKAAKDKEAADKVKQEIAAIPDDLSKETSDHVSGTVEAYNCLTDDQKKLITDEELGKLQKALNYPATKLKASLKSVKAGKGRKAVVKWKANKSANGYQLYYKAKGVKAKKVNIKDPKKVTKTIKKLKAGKKYSFKIRTVTKVQDLATGESRNVYGKWSKVRKAKAKK